MEQAITLRNLNKNYPDFKLNNINLDVPKGYIMGLIGENGAGKSTIINLLLNEIKEETGSIYINGLDLKEHEKQIKQDIGVIFDECNFIETFKVKNLDAILSNIYKNWDTDYYYELIRRFSLPENKKIKAFSKGMKMKLNFACTLAHRPTLLILDEATSGLDPIMRDEILLLLQEFIQDENHSVLLSSHITTDLEKIADYITFLHNGQILFSKTKDELLYSYGILRCGQEVFSRLHKEDMVAYRKEDYEWKVLVENCENMRKKFPDAIIDQATIDEIMLFHIKGEKLL